MNKTPQELFAERNQRIRDAIELRVPDRIPFTPLYQFFPARYAGISFRDAMYDYASLAAALKKITLDFQPDAYADILRNFALGPVLEMLDYRQLKWPGHGLPSDVTYQFVEREYMKANEYDAFMLDPSGFLLRTIFPRIYGTMEPLQRLPAVPQVYYTRVLAGIAALGEPEVGKAIQNLLKAGAEAKKVLTLSDELAREMESLGFPRLFGSAANCAFDYIGDYLRGTKGIMLDMYRQRDKLLEAVEKITRIIISFATTVPKINGVHRVFIPLHKGLDGFMSPEQFKTFYWPGLKKLMLALIDSGYTPNPLWEGDCTSRLEIIADMPHGKCIYWFERTDVFRAKEVLGDHICIEAGIPSSIMIAGSTEDVKAYSKKLIDIVGKGGGFIFNSDVGIPDEARFENVLTMVKFIKEYGVYR